MLQPEQGTGELKLLKSKEVTKGLQFGTFQSIEDAAIAHAKVLRQQGLKSGVHFAYNGKLLTSQGRQQVQYIPVCSMKACVM